MHSRRRTDLREDGDDDDVFGPDLSRDANAGLPDTDTHMADGTAQANTTQPGADGNNNNIPENNPFSTPTNKPRAKNRNSSSRKSRWDDTADEDDGGDSDRSRSAGPGKSGGKEKVKKSKQVLAQRQRRDRERRQQEARRETSTTPCNGSQA